MQARYDHDIEPWATKDEVFPLTVDGFEEPPKNINPKLDKKNMNKKHQMSAKFKQLVNQKRQYSSDEVMALYMNYKKPIKKVWGGGPGQLTKPQIVKGPKLERKPPVVTISQCPVKITKPTVPLVKSYYEKHITDAKIIEEGLLKGKFVAGRIFFDKKVADKHEGFVKVAGIEKAIKVMGLQNINRAFHLDTVVIKLQNWVHWEPA